MNVERCINVYVFPSTIRLDWWKRLLLGPLYLGSLYSRLSKCVQDITQSLGHYAMVTHVDNIFLYMFL